MGNVKTPADQQLLAAAAGNSALLELLESMMNTQRATGQIDNLTGKNVPPQATAQVSYLQGNYIIEITNPGAQSPLSAIQTAQQTQGATQATNFQNITSILHQIRCATSSAFGINDNLQTFGGDSGSTQTLWTINLGVGNYYFQTRSSYDGVNWNQWKNANGGQSITGFPSEVTLESQENSEWGVFTLPGNELLAVGEGFVADGGSFTLPEFLFSSAMAVIAGPNGYREAGAHMNDIPLCDVEVVTPESTAGLVGIPDFPILVRMQYANGATPQHTWSGSANIFGFAWDPAGANVTQYPGPGNGAFWVVFTLPGGAQLAIGQGQTPHGSNIWVPSELPWITGGSNMISICSPHGNQGGSNSAHGILKCQLTGLQAEMQYGDTDGGGGNVWTGNANWLAIAWTPGLPVVSVTGGQFLVIQMAGGHAIAFGGGQVLSDAAFTLPSGFTATNMLGIATPGGFSGSGGNDAHGVAQCDLIGTLCQLEYTDGSGDSWGGTANWMAFCWK